MPYIALNAVYVLFRAKQGAETAMTIHIGETAPDFGTDTS
jgi:hypothetical protein